MFKRLLTSEPDPVGDAVVRLVAERPRTREELLEALVEEGLDLGDVPENTVSVITRGHRRFHQLSDGRLVDVMSLFDGAISTTVIDDDSVAWRRPVGDSLADLAIVRLVERALPPIVVDGKTIKRARGSSNTLHAKAWLFSTEEGSPTRMTVRDGSIHIDTIVERVEGPGSEDPLVGSVGQLAETISRERIPAGVFDFLVELALERPRIFAVERPPFTALFRQAGLVVRDDHLVPVDLDWEDWLTEEADAWMEEE